MRMVGPAIMALMLAGAGATSALAQLMPGQTIGPGGTPMSPGPSQPRDFTPGGAGPGGARVSPGPAARDVNIEREGPGGTHLSPGPAGRAETRSAPATQVMAPASGGVSHTIRASSRKVHRGKTKRRGRPGM